MAFSQLKKAAICNACTGNGAPKCIKHWIEEYEHEEPGFGGFGAGGFGRRCCVRERV
jgi:hypothetical protein